MVKMNIHSEFNDFQISRFNEFFLVADMIRKARHSARQGFGKFKKLNLSGGDARLSTSTSNEDPPSLMDPLLRQCKDFAKLPRRQVFLSQEACLAKKGRTRYEHRRIRPLSVIRRDVSSQTRTRKRSRQGAMEDRAKVTPNSHLQRSPTKTSQPEPQRARLRRLEDLLSPRYS
jgi:hypothetical protein